MGVLLGRAELLACIQLSLEFLGCQAPVGWGGVAPGSPSLLLPGLWEQQAQVNSSQHSDLPSSICTFPATPSPAFPAEGKFPAGLGSQRRWNARHLRRRAARREKGAEGRGWTPLLFQMCPSWAAGK